MYEIFEKKNLLEGWTPWSYLFRLYESNGGGG